MNGRAAPPYHGCDAVLPWMVFMLGSEIKLVAHQRAELPCNVNIDSAVGQLDHLADALPLVISPDDNKVIAK